MNEIQELLHQMLERGASDLFISAEIPPHMRSSSLSDFSRR